MLLAVLGLLAAAQPALPFGEERLLLDRRLEALRRILPDGPTPTADQALVRELAEGAGLVSVVLEARPPVEAGARGEVIVDVAALGRFSDVDRFFRQAALSARLIDVESLVLSATGEGLVKLAAVVRLPFRPAKAPLPAPPEPRTRLAGVPRPALEAYQQDQALALAKSETLVQLRRSRRNPRLFLSELAAITRDRPVVLNFASQADEFVVRGIAVGEGSVRALESRFERGFFRVAEFLMARLGACHRFEVRGRSPVAGIDAELPLPAEDPFVQDDAPCRADRDPPRAVTVRGGNPKVAGQGPLTLRLRDVDFADVFRVLHILTTLGFLVDGDTTGRVSLDLSRLTLDEALLAIEKSGVDVADSGRLRRVSLRGGGVNPPPLSSRGGSPAPDPVLGGTPASGGPPTATFAVKRADVRELLALMTDMEPGLAALGPQGFLGRVSLWARDTPVLDLRAVVLEAVGLSERIEEGSRILERTPGSGEALAPVAGTGLERRLVLGPQGLSVMEFELAGLASAGDGWIAFAYSPTGTLGAYRQGDRLADGVVRSVQSTDVVIETEEGPVRYTLAPLGR
ncbi:MAG TPA: hypothetical protein VLI67_01470 [Vicinamibacteria bacterium]|nr:hypothetical protein [Vicinamibacteria bacterium]